MKKLTALFALAFVVVLAGCGAQPTENQEATTDTGSNAEVVESTETAETETAEETTEDTTMQDDDADAAQAEATETAEQVVDEVEQMIEDAAADSSN